MLAMSHQYTRSSYTVTAARWLRWLEDSKRARNMRIMYALTLPDSLVVAVSLARQYHLFYHSFV